MISGTQLANDLYATEASITKLIVNNFARNSLSAALSKFIFYLGGFSKMARLSDIVLLLLVSLVYISIARGELNFSCHLMEESH